MNFIKFPSGVNTASKLTYFKPLIKTQPFTEVDNASNKLELWNIEAHRKNDFKPKWTWKIKSEKNLLEFPIIHPCNGDWNLKWTKNGEVIKEHQVKRFDLKNKIDYCPFLVIKELKIN